MQRLLTLSFLCLLAMGGRAQIQEELVDEYAKAIDRLIPAEEYDSAAYYATLIAELDTTRVEWQYQTAYCMEFMGMNEEAIFYYRRALALYRKMEQESPSACEDCMLNTLAHLAPLYQEAWMDADCEAAYQEMVALCRARAKSTPQKYLPSLAATLNGFAFFYMGINLHDKAEPLNQEALQLYRELAKEDDAYEAELANTLHNLATLYFDTGDWDKTRELGNEAMEIYQRLQPEDPQLYGARIEMLKTYVLDKVNGVGQ